LVPVAQAWPEWRRVSRLLVAATVPIALIGLGLMLYNARRFDNPFEFGWRYQLAGKRQVTMQFLTLRYLWFNFRVYFLEPARWSRRFPFVHGIAVPPLPAGYYGVEDPFGILTNIPLAWLALAVPLAWRRRSGQAGSILRWFVTAVALFFATCALTIGTFVAASMRYAVDFLPALMLLAVVGILGCERALAPTSESGLADRPVWRPAARWGWSVLLGFSVVFNVLVSVVNYAHIGCGLASVLAIKGRAPEAFRVFKDSLRIDPDFTDGHVNLGRALCQAGRGQEAIREEEYALQLDPTSAEAHYVYGVALQQLRDLPEAIVQYEQALRIDPDYAEAHNDLGTALAQAGKIAEAIAHYEQALRINPDFAEAHYNLGIDLAQAGKAAEAIAHYEQALRINPDYAEAHNNLGIALAQCGKFAEAIAHYEQALRINPDYAEARYNCGAVLEQVGRVPEAIEHYVQILKLQPDFAPAKKALARLRAGK
jgi:tetratricopeptide (TPR) repeat protein